MIRASRLLAPILAVAGAGAILMAGQSIEPTPARLLWGSLPPLPPLVTGGGEVVLELDVTRDGRSAAATVLRATPPFTDLMLASVKQWTFEPATTVEPPEKPGERPLAEPAPSSVLVVGVFRPPAASGPTIGELPKDIRTPSRGVPFPLAIRMPPWPPLAVAGGVVLVEARIDGGGNVAEARVAQGAPGFDAVAVETVRGWSFRPVRAADAPAYSYAYVVLGFPAPVTFNDRKR